MLAIAGCGFMVLFRQNGLTASVLTAVWTGAILAGWFAVRKMGRQALRLVASMALVLVTGLSGFDLVARPIISEKASGKSFVNASEGLVNSRYPVAIYGLGRDGDGAKYALYSSRRPETLRFVSQIEEIPRLPRPCLLITSEEDLTELQTLLQTVRHRPLTKGVIRSHAVAAYILESNDAG